MNNLRLLTGVLVTGALVSGGFRGVAGQPVLITLEEIFECAEKNSSLLRPSITAIDESEKDIYVARAQRLPDVTTNLSFSYIGDGFTTKRNFSDYQKAPIPHFGSGFGITVSQPVYTGGAITRSIELAQLKSTAARYASDLKRDNIRFELTGYYLDIYKCYNLRKVVENNLANARKLLADMTVRFAEGTALQNDITRYELLVSNLELELIKINNTLDILNNNLIVTAGLTEGITVIPDSTILLKSLPVSGEKHWQEITTKNSPGLLLARNSVDISKQAEELVKSERLPKIGLQAGWTIDGPILVEVPPINRNLSYWWVGVGISYNLSSLWKNNKNVEKSRVSTHKAIEELYAGEESLQMAVRAEYTKYLEAYEELKSQNKSVELAERNYNVTSTRYLADMALITDMLDAANSKLEAEQHLVNAEINIIYYYYKLLFISGTI